MEAELARSLEAFRAHPRGRWLLAGPVNSGKSSFLEMFLEALKREMPSLNVGGLLSRGVFGESGKIAYEGRDLQNVAKDGEGAAIFMELFCGAAGGALGGAAGAAAANWLGVGNKSIPPFLLALKSELSAGESALIQSAFGISWEMTNTAPSVSMGQWRIFESGLACGRKAIERAVREKCDLVVVDEFGPLERSGGGLRAAVDEAAIACAPLLVVARESLCESLNGIYGELRILPWRSAPAASAASPAAASGPLVNL